METERLQVLCDRLLRELRRTPERIPAEVGPEIHSLLKAHPDRQLERERRLFVPIFMGKLFQQALDRGLDLNRSNDSRR